MDIPDPRSGRDLNNLRTNGIWRAHGAVLNVPPIGIMQVLHGGQAAGYAAQLAIGIQANRILARRCEGDIWNSWYEIRTTANTTVDSNGFVKAASPILRLFADGFIEEPVQQTEAEVTRTTTGTYRIANTVGLAATGWQIEVPRDHNGNILCHVETAWDGDDLTVSAS